MKLNLLPVTVKTGAKTRNAVIGSVLIVAAGVFVSAFLITTSSAADDAAKKRVEDDRPAAEKAYKTSTDADAIMQQAAAPLRDLKLGKAMLEHNGAYPRAYEDIFKYNPSYFRLTSITASPIDATTSNITMTGTITSYQQYADLMLALMRNPKVVSVSRGGYVMDVNEVPALVPVDQKGKPRKPNAAPIPDDPLERLTYFESQPTEAGYTGVSNYGAGNDNTKLAKPGDSLITIQMVASYALQTPNPRATLEATGAAAGAGIPSAPGASVAPGAVPGGSVGAATPPPPPAGAATGKGKGKKGDDSSD